MLVKERYYIHCYSAANASVWSQGKWLPLTAATWFVRAIRAVPHTIAHPWLRDADAVVAAELTWRTLSSRHRRGSWGGNFINTTERKPVSNAIDDFVKDGDGQRSWSFAGTVDVQGKSRGLMGPVRVRHSSHHFATQPSHSVDLAGWQAKMASIEIWIPWCNTNVHRPH